MSRPMEICPRCEDAILVSVEIPYEVEVSGTKVRIPRVQAEECRACGFRALSGREVRLFDVLFAPQYQNLKELIQALRSAGYMGMFLREDREESNLAFGARRYVAQLDEGVRDFYLDNESSHIIDGLFEAQAGFVALELPDRRCTVRLPRLGEGECGLVYDYKEDAGTVLKLAKPRPYSREHLRKEFLSTEVFVRHGIPVPPVFDHDPHGSYLIKGRLEGESLAKVYDRLGQPGAPPHRLVRAAVEVFLGKLMELFVKLPEVKTSVSPNNIFVTLTDQACECLLVDTGPAPFHDYSRFNFSEYWEVTIPKKIAQYRKVGYI
jgi:hypothetical protein